MRPRAGLAALAAFLILAAGSATALAEETAPHTGGEVWTEYAAPDENVAREGRTAMPFTIDQIEALGRLLRETQGAASLAAEPAFALAVRAGIGGGRLRDGLTDASPAVRRLAAIAMGMRGDAEARERLVDELERNPTAEVIEALAGIGDDDAIVHLGRCAERHPALAESVLDGLRNMESTKAQRLVRRLEAVRPRAVARACAVGDGTDD